MHIRDRKLIPVWEKVQRGERLTLEDGLTLYDSADLIGLGKMAHAVQQAAERRRGLLRPEPEDRAHEHLRALVQVL